VKEIKNKSLFSERIKKINIKKKDFPIGEFSFMKSELKGKFYIYKTLMKFPLK